MNLPRHRTAPTRRIPRAAGGARPDAASLPGSGFGFSSPCHIKRTLLFLALILLSLCCPRAAGSPVVSGPGLAGSLSSLGPARSARLAPRQSLPANVVACPTFRFSSTPYIPALTSSCSGSGSKVLLRSGIALAAAPATALSCSVMTGRFDLTDTDGTSWLGGSSLEQTSAEYAAVDQMFLLAGSAGTTLSADPAKCGDTFAELAFARNEVAGRLLRLELKCNNGAYIGYLYFKWYPTGFTPVPANLSTFACGAAGSTYFDWTTGSAYTPAAPSRTTAGLALTAWPATSSTTGKISSTTLAPAPSPALAGDLVPAAATTTTTTQTVLLKTSTLTAKPTTTAALFGDNKNLSLSCPTFPAGTNPPGPGNLLDAFDKGVFNYLVSSKNVPGRTMLIYLGDDPSIAACRGVLQSPANASDCEIRYRLKGSWRQLRGCTWKSDPEDKGYIPMRNSLTVTWNDTFPGPLGLPKIIDSSLAWSVEINLPTVVDLQADVAIVEESGIKNFILTGFFLTQKDDGSRSLILDYQMWSRWPNELTYDTISSLPFVPAGPLSVVELQGPDISLCHLDPVTKTYTTNSECWQYGSIEIPLGPVCNVSGPYTFTFDSDCFSGTGNGNNCTGTKLSANAIIEGVDLCTSLLATASNVTGNLTVDKPGGYFFGDSITLNATFKSPDVPLFETRLMSAEVIIAKFNKNPILLYAHSEGNVLLGTNTNFTITQNGSVSPYEVLMRLTPNMKPTFEEGAFLTTEDFDTADNSFSFRLRFRVFFDATSADRNSTTRRRRALFRDLAVNSHTLQRRLTPTLGSIQELQVGIQSNMQVPNRAEVLDTHPDMVPAGTLPPEGNNSGQSAVTPVWIYAVAAVAGLVIVAGIGACVWFCCMKRRRSSGPEDEFGETQGLVQGANPAGFSPDSFAVPTPDWTKSTWNVGGIPDVGKLFGPEMGFSGAPSYSSAFGSSAGYDAPGVNVASMFGETPPQSMKEKRRNRR